MASNTKPFVARMLFVSAFLLKTVDGFPLHNAHEGALFIRTNMNAQFNQATSKSVPDVGKSVSINTSAFATNHSPLLDTGKDMVADQGAATSTKEDDSTPLTGKVPLQEDGATQNNGNATSAKGPADGTNTLDNDEGNNYLSIFVGTCFLSLLCFSCHSLLNPSVSELDNRQD